MSLMSISDCPKSWENLSGHGDLCPASETLKRPQSLVLSQNRFSQKMFIFWTRCQARDIPHILKSTLELHIPFSSISERGWPLSSAWYQFFWKPSNARNGWNSCFAPVLGKDYICRGDADREVKIDLTLNPSLPFTSCKATQRVV